LAGKQPKITRRQFFKRVGIGLGIVGLGAVTLGPAAARSYLIYKIDRIEGMRNARGIVRREGRNHNIPPENIQLRRYQIREELGGNELYSKILSKTDRRSNENAVVSLYNDIRIVRLEDKVETALLKEIQSGQFELKPFNPKESPEFELWWKKILRETRQQ